jgi:hypothetical protein
MAPNRKMSVPSARRLLDRLRGGGKKTVMACALLLIMLFMWVRVVVGHRPAPAAAAPQPVQTESVPRKAPVKVKLVELSVLPGRHDSIERDFFTGIERTYARRDSAGRDTGTEKEVPVVSSNSAQEVIQRVAKTMKLEAVLGRERPRAFINDQLLSLGGKLTVKDGAEIFEFEVLQISADAVLVECKGVQLTLALAQGLEAVH